MVKDMTNQELKAEFNRLDKWLSTERWRCKNQELIRMMIQKNNIIREELSHRAVSDHLYK